MLTYNICIANNNYNAAGLSVCAYFSKKHNSPFWILLKNHNDYYYYDMISYIIHTILSNLLFSDSPIAQTTFSFFFFVSNVNSCFFDLFFSNISDAIGQTNHFKPITGILWSKRKKKCWAILFITHLRDNW